MATDFDDRERRRTVLPVREIPVHDRDQTNRRKRDLRDERPRRRSLVRLVHECLGRFLDRRTVPTISYADLDRLNRLIIVDTDDLDREGGGL